jgi:sarcosine oxidase subunit gamma
MLERRSPLGASARIECPRLRVSESSDFSLTQLSGLSRGFEKDVAAAVGKIPARIGIASTYGGETVFRVGPKQVWIAGGPGYQLPKDLALAHAAISMSHSRVRLLIEGSAARDLLSKGIALDFHSSAFEPGQFALTGLDHTPVLVLCNGAESFHLFSLSTFAVSVWDWLMDAALEYRAS